MLRLTLHNTHFLIFVLETVSGNTFFDQTSFSDPLFKTHTHDDHLCKVVRSTSNHFLVIELIQSVQENLGQFFLFQRWTNLCAKSLHRCICFEGIIIILGHGLQFVSVWGKEQVVVVLLDESLAQLIESFDISLVQTHISHQCGTSQVVFEIVDKELIIIILSGNLSRVNHQMNLRASVPFVLFKIGNFEFRWYHDIGNQIKIINIFPEQFFSTESFQFQLQSIKLFFQFINPVVCSHTF